MLFDKVVYKQRMILIACSYNNLNTISYLAEHCPVDNHPLHIVVANLAVGDQVGELTMHCKYGLKQSTDGSGTFEVDSHGCPLKVKMSHRR